MRKPTINNYVSILLVLLVIVPNVGIKRPALTQELQCANRSQADAFAVRDLQSRLMVAALGCGQATAYNAFVHAHQFDLRRAGKNLSSYFSTSGRGMRHLDAYVTRAANAAAQRHANNQRLFCANAATMFRDLAAVSKASLVDVAYKAALPSIAKPRMCDLTETPPAPGRKFGEERFAE